MRNILIIEDEIIIRKALRRLLERNNFSVAEAGSVHEAEESNNLDTFDLVITDLRLPGEPGTAIIDKCGGVPVLVMTSYASVKSAVESMKMGAVDYISKPFDHDEMLLTIERILKQSQLERQNQILKNEVARNYPVDGMIGLSKGMAAVGELIKRAAPTDVTVLISGESGTGKELAARAVHANSKRAEGPIVTMNCAAIPEGLIESELFGHEKGSFTGAIGTRHGLIETADGGSLFLDEIGELSLSAQARLLRVLQEGEIRRVGSSQDRKVDIRLIVATHRNLQQRVTDGLFREDLFFRLNVMEINLPPLRDRAEDIELLANYLLQKATNKLNKSTMKFSPECLTALNQHNWPGNVRELENSIERAVILCDSNVIGADLLAINKNDGAAKSTQKSNSRTDLSLEDYFRQFVEENQNSMTETELAKRLGISRKALWERRQRFSIPRSR